MIPVKVSLPDPPAPTPIIPTPNLESASWWQWLLTTVLSIAVAIGVLVGHPFNSSTLSAVVPSVALVAASVSTALQVHGIHKVKVAYLNYKAHIHGVMLQVEARKAMQEKAFAHRLAMLTEATGVGSPVAGTVPAGGGADTSVAPQAPDPVGSAQGASISPSQPASS